MSERPNVEGIRKTYAEDIDLRSRAMHGVTLLGSEDIVEFCDYTLALESRIEDKDASIAQLIEQLEKAEAQNAADEALMAAWKAGELVVQAPNKDALLSQSNTSRKDWDSLPANADNATPSADQDIADHTKWADIKTERANRTLGETNA